MYLYIIQNVINHIDFLTFLFMHHWKSVNFGDQDFDNIPASSFRNSIKTFALKDNVFTIPVNKKLSKYHKCSYWHKKQFD